MVGNQQIEQLSYYSKLFTRLRVNHAHGVAPHKPILVLSGEDDQVIIPNDRFTEESPQDTRPMKEFDGEPIFLPTQETYYPRLKALHWHRQRWNII